MLLSTLHRGYSLLLDYDNILVAIGAVAQILTGYDEAYLQGLFCLSQQLLLRPSQHRSALYRKYK